jgi:hypothetical protein
VANPGDRSGGQFKLLLGEITRIFLKITEWEPGCETKIPINRGSRSGWLEKPDQFAGSVCS